MFFTVRNCNPHFFRLKTKPRHSPRNAGTMQNKNLAHFQRYPLPCPGGEPASAATES